MFPAKQNSVAKFLLGAVDVSLQSLVLIARFTALIVSSVIDSFPVDVRFIVDIVLTSVDCVDVIRFQ